MLVNGQLLCLLRIEHFNHAGVSRAWLSMNKGQPISISTTATVGEGLGTFKLRFQPADHSVTIPLDDNY